MLHTTPARWITALVALLLTSAPVQAQTDAAAPHLANITILATGGTIAGTGSSSTTTIGYTAATVGVQTLIAAVPELAKVAHVSGEQTMQIASESMDNAHWLTLAKRANVLRARDDVAAIATPHGPDTPKEPA